MSNKHNNKMNKQFMFGCMGILMVAATFTACSSDDDNNNPGTGTTTGYTWTKDGGLNASSGILFTGGKDDAAGTEIGNGDQEFVFTGKQTLKKGTYTFKGWVYVAKGAELTIEPGTIIKGEKESQASLIVEPGGKLFAKGTASAPIVFTSAQPKGSRRPGDWGGLIICGNAVNNQDLMQIEGGPRTKHGGNDNTDNSGILSYVRIEFAGYPFQTDKEINGLTLGSVGSGTQIDHIQVSYSNDDSFEWFGGSVNAKYLIAYKGWDDDFDTDNGYSGKVQYGLVVRDPRIADISMSNGFESDNKADGGAVAPYTTATFSNITFVGPKFDGSFQNTTSYINAGNMKPQNSASLGLFQSAMQIRRSSRLNCFNSVALGYPVGLILDGEKGSTVTAAKDGLLKVNNVWFAGMDAVGVDANKETADVLITYVDGKPVKDATQKSFSSTWFQAQSGNQVKATIAELGLSVNGFIPSANSPLLSAPTYTSLDSWFDKVSYIGAFGASNDWTAGWANFDPQNTDY